MDCPNYFSGLRSTFILDLKQLHPQKLSLSFTVISAEMLPALYSMNYRKDMKQNIKHVKYVLLVKEKVKSKEKVERDVPLGKAAGPKVTS